MNFFLISSLLLAATVFAAETENGNTTLADFEKRFKEYSKKVLILLNTLTEKCNGYPSASSGSAAYQDSYVKPFQSGNGVAESDIRSIIANLLKGNNNDNTNTNTNFGGLFGGKTRFPESYQIPVYFGQTSVPSGASFVPIGNGNGAQGAYTVAQQNVAYQPQQVPQQQQVPISVQYQAQPTPIQFTSQAVPVPAPVPAQIPYAGPQPGPVPVPVAVPTQIGTGSYPTAPSSQQYVTAKKK